ncbi:MAG TPA: helix-turn-helix domain-containing protein [Fimbriimonadaceae bacterium]|nr:helix-turn-helix domain-containing protein [Fimbriimonadaceae bacterium]
MSNAQLFSALGDVNRLDLLSRLSPDTPRTLSQLASGAGISRQGVRKHVQVLADANLVRLEPKGREVLIRANPERLDEGIEMLHALTRRWQVKLEALKSFVEEKG